MYFHKQQILQKITSISQARHTHDRTLLSLQQLLTENKKYEIVQLRNKFTSFVEDLQKIIKSNIGVLELLEYRVEKLGREQRDIVKEKEKEEKNGSSNRNRSPASTTNSQITSLNNQKIRIESLKQYFTQLKQKTTRQQQRGQQLITSRQRWQLSKYKPTTPTQQQDQQNSLLTSHTTTKQTTQLARTVLENIANQSNRLEKAREKMGGVIKNINFSGNLAQLMRTRTREDNRLIGMLSLGLVMWIFVCVFVVKPLYRGTG